MNHDVVAREGRLVLVSQLWLVGFSKSNQALPFVTKGLPARILFSHRPWILASIRQFRFSLEFVAFSFWTRFLFDGFLPFSTRRIYPQNAPFCPQLQVLDCIDSLRPVGLLESTKLVILAGRILMSAATKSVFVSYSCKFHDGLIVIYLRTSSYPFSVPKMMIRNGWSKSKSWKQISPALGLVHE